MSAPARREFIPAIRAIIVKGCPGAETAIQESIDAWRDGEDPKSPWDQGVFGVCDSIATDLDEKADAEPDLDDLEEEGDS